VFRNKLDKVAVQNFLESMEKITGWSMKKDIESLKQQWAEDSDQD